MVAQVKVDLNYWQKHQSQFYRLLLWLLVKFRLKLLDEVIV
jgi:hypothetical protein